MLFFILKLFKTLSYLIIETGSCQGFASENKTDGPIPQSKSFFHYLTFMTHRTKFILSLCTNIPCTNSTYNFEKSLRFRNAIDRTT